MFKFVLLALTASVVSAQDDCTATAEKACADSGLTGDDLTTCKSNGKTTCEAAAKAAEDVAGALDDMGDAISDAMKEAEEEMGAATLASAAFVVAAAMLQ